MDDGQAHGIMMDFPLLNVEESDFDSNAYFKSVFQLRKDILKTRVRSPDASSRINARKQTTQRELYRRLCLAKDFINSSYPAAVSLNDIARVACMSVHHLLRQFKHFFGITPHQFLTCRRLEAAERLLIVTNKTVSEICHEVGYDDVSSFSRLFKSRFKSAPEKFRRAHQIKNQFV